MTKEELKLEALKYLENFQNCAKCKHRWGDCADELDEDCLINNCYSATPKEQDIYLAGAEPREKRIEELEDKLANADYQLEGRDLEIKDLEKENAELKGLKDVATLIRANNDTVVTLMQLNNKLVSKSQQLTKAIELLKETQGYIENIDDILYDEIEQFMKEIEK